MGIPGIILQARLRKGVLSAFSLYGACSSIGRAEGCGPSGCGFESRLAPLVDVRCSNCHRIRTAAQFGWYAPVSPPSDTRLKG